MASISPTFLTPTSTLTSLPTSPVSHANAPDASTPTALAGPSSQATRSVQEIEADLLTVGARLQEAYKTLRASNQRNTHVPNQAELLSSTFDGIHETRRSPRAVGTPESARASIVFHESGTGNKKEWHLFAKTPETVAKLQTAAQDAREFENLKNELSTVNQQPVRTPFTSFGVNIRSKKASLLGLPLEIQKNVLQFTGPRQAQYDENDFSKVVQESREPTVKALALTSRSTYNLVLPDLLIKHLENRTVRIETPGLAPNERWEEFQEILNQVATDGLDKEGKKHILGFLGEVISALPQANRIEAMNNFHVQVRNLKDSDAARIYERSIEMLSYLPEEPRQEAFNHIQTLTAELHESSKSAIFTRLATHLYSWNNEQRKIGNFNQILSHALQLGGADRAAVLGELASGAATFNTEEQRQSAFNVLREEAYRLQGANQNDVLARIKSASGDYSD